MYSSQHTRGVGNGYARLPAERLRNRYEPYANALDVPPPPPPTCLRTCPKPETRANFTLRFGLRKCSQNQCRRLLESPPDARRTCSELACRGRRGVPTALESCRRRLKTDSRAPRGGREGVCSANDQHFRSRFLSRGMYRPTVLEGGSAPAYLPCREPREIVATRYYRLGWKQFRATFCRLVYRVRRGRKGAGRPAATASHLV
jgi:hypothetical protein